MKQLTKAEEQIMLIFWERGKSSVWDIIECLSKPKPAYTTTSTIIRLLVNKGFLGHESLGKGYVYFPVINKIDYAHQFMCNLLNNYFNGSAKELVLFLCQCDILKIYDIEEFLIEFKPNEIYSDN